MIQIRMIETRPWRYKLQTIHSVNHLNIRYLNLPFDLAQGGEPVEPFRISIFGFRIYRNRLY